MDAACIPADYSPPASQTRELIVHALLRVDAVHAADDVPALRRKRFVDVNAARRDAVIDEEIVPGIEDLQVRFGVDTNGRATAANADTYVDPGSVPAGRRTIVSATDVAARPCRGSRSRHVDGDAYSYADVNIGDARATITAASSSRKTIQLRNSRS